MAATIPKAKLLDGIYDAKGDFQETGREDASFFMPLYKKRVARTDKLGWDYIASYASIPLPKTDSDGYYYDNQKELAKQTVINGEHDFWQFSRAFARLNVIANGFNEHPAYETPVADWFGDLFDGWLGEDWQPGLNEEAVGTAYTALSLLYLGYFGYLFFFKAGNGALKGWASEYLEAINAALDENYVPRAYRDDTQAHEREEAGKWRKNLPRRIIHSMVEAITWGIANLVSAVIAFEKCLGGSENAGLLNSLSWALFTVAIIIDTLNTVIEQTAAINALKQKIKSTTHPLTPEEKDECNRKITVLQWNRFTTVFFGLSATAAGFCSMTAGVLEHFNVEMFAEVISNLTFAAGYLLVVPSLLFVAIRSGVELWSIFKESQALSAKWNLGAGLENAGNAHIHLQQQLLLYKAAKCVVYTLTMITFIGVAFLTGPVGAIIAFSALFVVRAAYNRLIDPLVEEKIAQSARKDHETALTTLKTAAPAPAAAAAAAAPAAAVAAAPAAAPLGGIGYST